MQAAQADKSSVAYVKVISYTVVCIDSQQGPICNLQTVKALISLPVHAC